MKRAAALTVTSIALLCSCGPDDATEAAPGAVTLTCADNFDQIVDLFRSGLPTYDYEPAADLSALVQRSAVVLTGSISTAVRTVTEDQSGTTFTTSGARVIVPAGATQNVTEFTTSSVWAVRDEPDPLAEPVDFDGLSFVVFLDERTDTPGGYQVDVQGLSIGCRGSTDVATPVIGPLPADVADASIDELVAALSESVASN